MRSLVGSSPTTTRRLRRSTAHSLWEDREPRQGAPQSDNLEIVSPQFIPLKPAQPQNTPRGSTPRHCALGFIGANHSKRPTAQRPHDVAPLPFDQRHPEASDALKRALISPIANQDHGRLKCRRESKSLSDGVQRSISTPCSIE